MILPRQDNNNNNNNNDPVFGTDDDEFAYDSFWYTKVCMSAAPLVLARLL